MTLEYGIIGNCRTVALISREASIEWLCMPRFSAPSIFTRILDTRKGGSFRIEPKKKCEINQCYMENTNILCTTFSEGQNEVEVLDYFPHYEENGMLKKGSEIHRVITPKKGSMDIRFVIDPVFDYASKKPKVTLEKDRIAYKTGYESMYIYSNMDLKKLMEGKHVNVSKESYILLTYNRIKPRLSMREIKEEMRKTAEYWQNWSSTINPPNEFKEQVIRSALVLRLLTYDDSGAVVAAPTTSLPEIAGDVRNWDYRYCWIRDASFAIRSLLSIGKEDVAHEFMKWLNRISSESGTVQQIVYGINGERELKERTLDYLTGYKSSRPVRVGNAAYLQRQIDIFGELLDSIHFFYIDYKVKRLSKDQWDIVYSSAETVTDLWKSKDSSIWEFRNTQEHFTFSKVMCWVAMDRAIKIATQFKMKGHLSRWKKTANEIKEDVMKNGWNGKINSFVQYYGSEELDASLLLLPFFGFIDYKDPKMRGTVEAIKGRLMRNGFVIRYTSNDDFGKPRNALIACTFWLVEALYKMGNKSEALRLFNSTIENVNHLGLLSEDIDPDTKELLGNFPQAYSHIALINTAMTIREQKD